MKIQNRREVKQHVFETMYLKKQLVPTIDRTFNAYHRKWQRTYIRKLRQEVIKKLGGKCVRCGFTDVRALQVDHVNGGGTREKKSLSSLAFTHRILEDTKGNYQLLCANCNWIKRYEKKENAKIIRCKKNPSWFAESIVSA